jgi:hypothetical protein
MGRRRGYIFDLRLRIAHFMNEQTKASPLFTVLLTSHCKPSLVHEAVQSVLAQTFEDYELLIVDSGALFGRLVADYGGLPGVRVELNGETEEIVRTKAVLAWVCNRWVPEARGRYVTYLHDDDLYKPSYLAAFAAAIEGQYYPPECLWTGVEIVRVNEDGGDGGHLGHCLPKGSPRAGLCNHLQMCHSKAAFEAAAHAYHGEAWPEDPARRGDCDGHFMERLASRWPFKMVDGVHAVNRRTPLSEFAGT